MIGYANKYNFDMNKITSIEDGNALIAAGTWHTLRSLETGTVILEMKDGAYEPMREGDVLNV